MNDTTLVDVVSDELLRAVDDEGDWWRHTHLLYSFVSMKFEFGWTLKCPIYMYICSARTSWIWVETLLLYSKRTKVFAHEMQVHNLCHLLTN